MTQAPGESPSESVDIEVIMQQIRRQILAKKAALGPAQPTSLTPVGGKRLPPTFYEHLYQAALAHDQVGVKLWVTPVQLPLVGRLLERLRVKFHELVVYYVNQTAAQQIKVNHHLLQALSILSQELEKEAEEPAGHDLSPD